MEGILKGLLGVCGEGRIKIRVRRQLAVVRTRNTSRTDDERCLVIMCVCVCVGSFLLRRSIGGGEDLTESNTGRRGNMDKPYCTKTCPVLKAPNDITLSPVTS